MFIFKNNDCVLFVCVSDFCLVAEKYVSMSSCVKYEICYLKYIYLFNNENVIYLEKMGKQTMGTPCYAYTNRTDNKATINFTRI